MRQNGLRDLEDHGGVVGVARVDALPEGLDGQENAGEVVGVSAVEAVEDGHDVGARGLDAGEVHGLAVAGDLAALHLVGVVLLEDRDARFDGLVVFPGERVEREQAVEVKLRGREVVGDVLAAGHSELGGELVLAAVLGHGGLAGLVLVEHVEAERAVVDGDARVGVVVAGHHHGLDEALGGAAHVEDALGALRAGVERHHHEDEGDGQHGQRGHEPDEAAELAAGAVLLHAAAVAAALAAAEAAQPAEDQEREHDARGRHDDEEWGFGLLVSDGFLGQSVLVVHRACDCDDIQGFQHQDLVFEQALQSTRLVSCKIWHFDSIFVFADR